MAGKGQPRGFIGNPVGKNQYVEEAGSGERTKRFSVRVTPSMDLAIRASVEAEGTSLTQWVENAFERKLKGVVGVRSDIEIEAIALAMELKKAALARELKRGQPDKALIEKWRYQIEQLEKVLLI